MKERKKASNRFASLLCQLVSLENPLCQLSLQVCSLGFSYWVSQKGKPGHHCQCLPPIDQHNVLRTKRVWVMKGIFNLCPKGEWDSRLFYSTWKSLPLSVPLFLGEPQSFWLGVSHHSSSLDKIYCVYQPSSPVTFGVCKCLPELGLFVLGHNSASFTQLSLQFRVSAFCKEMKHTQLLEGGPHASVPLFFNSVFITFPLGRSTESCQWAQTPLATLEL